MAAITNPVSSLSVLYRTQNESKSQFLEKQFQVQDQTMKWEWDLRLNPC